MGAEGAWMGLRRAGRARQGRFKTRRQGGHRKWWEGKPNLLTTFRGGKNQFNYICGRLLKGPDLLIIHY